MFASIQAESLFYLRYGRGRPMLVLHGGPGLGHGYLRPYLDALGQVVELIYFDHRGNGRSSGRADVGRVTLETWVDDAEALRVALKLGPVVLLGHGFGGLLAQLYARRYPDAVAGLVLVSTMPALDYPMQMLSGARAAGSPEAVAAVLASMTTPAASDEALKATWTAALPAYFYRYQAMYQAALGDGLTYSAAAYNRALFDLMPAFSSVGWLGELRRPALVLQGRHDWWAPVTEGAQRLCAGLRQATLTTFEHSSHYPFVEETTAFCHTVKAFVQSLPPAKS